MSRPFEELQKQFPVLDELATLVMERRALRDLWNDMHYLQASVEDDNLQAYMDDIEVAGRYLTSQIQGRLQRLIDTGNHRKTTQEGSG